MNNLHPRVKELLERQAGPGAEIVEVSAGDVNRSLITVEVNGVRTQVSLPKGDLGQRFNGQIPTVVGEAGESVVNLLKRFSEKYHLNLLMEVDVAEKELLSFADSDPSQTIITVSILPTSVVWKGSVLLHVYNKDNVIKPEGIQTPQLEDARVVMALTSKIFPGNGEVLNTNKDGLTLAFSKKVITYLKSCGITSLSPNDLGQGKLMDVVADGFSGIAVVKPKTGPVLFIRYRSKGEDVNIPTPGDEDTE